MELEKIKLIPDKKQIQAMAVSEAKKMIDGGNDNPLLLRIHIKRMIEFLTVYDKEIDDAVREEAEASGYKSFEYQGAKIELAEVGVKYDYSKSPVWSQLKGQSDEIGAKMKEHETFLKSLSQPIEVLDQETGEVVRFHPPAKSSKSSVKITL